MSVSAHATSQCEPSGPPHVHHMDSNTAYSAAKFGMWLFLATEILLFSVLFVSYLLYHWWYYDAFHHGSQSLNRWMGGFNTLVLLFSSFTAALAVSAAQRGDNKRVTKLFSITIVCGLAFLVIKYFEWSEKAALGKFIGGENFYIYGNFLPIYYCMTGLHALHVIIGMGLLIWVLTKSTKNRFDSRYFTPVEIAALYWHLVDLIWIYLFPLLYLVG